MRCRRSRMKETIIAGSVSYVCPKCKCQLRPIDNALCCNKCDQTYPIISSIPDFTVGKSELHSIYESRLFFTIRRQTMETLMSINKSSQYGILIVLLWCACSICFPQSIDHYLHKNAFFDLGPSSDMLNYSMHKPISHRKAASFAVDHLKAKGVTNIVICEVWWIAAPLGGYLVDAKGKATIKDTIYTIFRVGVRDGTDERDGKSLSGEMFVFIAFGKDKSGRPHWYPPPGPDIWPPRSEADSSILDYEFLLNRGKFETLDKRYR